MKIWASSEAKGDGRLVNCVQSSCYCYCSKQEEEKRCLYTRRQSTTTTASLFFHRHHILHVARQVHIVSTRETYTPVVLYDGLKKA